MIYYNGSQLRGLLPEGHLVMAGDIFDKLEVGERMLLASGG